jgi:hypothetical protein
MVQGLPSGPGPPPTRWTSPPQRRYRFRNLSNSAVKLLFYNSDDSLQLFTLPNGAKTINAHAEVAYPEREFTGPLLPTIEKLTVWIRDDIQPTLAAGRLLTISASGSVSVGDYTPPPRQ